MSNEQIKQGENIINPETAGQGNDQSGDSQSPKGNSEGNKLLGKTTKARRPRGAKTEQGREKTNQPKVSRFAFRATVPTMQYGNIQPEIELQGVTIEEGEAIVMPYLESLFASYGEKPLTKKEVSTAVVTREKVKSFNEDVEIEYDPINHSYFYEGKKLTGVTDHIKTFYKAFDVASIAPACAKAWNCTEEEVKNIWKANGDLTSALGDAIHKMLENYDFHREIGAKIAEIKKLEDNYVMPKHPILRDIMAKFIAIDTAKNQTIVPEVIITDIKKGFCGRTDRLVITGDKKCVVQDYKINIESEKEDKNNKITAEQFKDLPSNKISKYQLQMSVYANMLENSGWTVEGLEVFVLENEWKLHQLPVLKVI